MTREEAANLLKHWEQPRHLMFWSNHSSIMNHGHVLLTVTAIYDPAFYYTPEKLGGRNVQDLMKKPQIYLLARCRDTLRIRCCTEDIRQVTTKIDSSHNVPITCICLLFRCDHPAQEVESGEQIGGNVSSSGCTTSSTQYPDHIAPQQNLEERWKSHCRSSWTRKEKWKHTWVKMSWLESERDEISQQMDCWNQPIEKGVEGYLVVPALSFPHHLGLMKDLSWPSMR